MKTTHTPGPWKFYTANRSATPSIETASDAAVHARIATIDRHLPFSESRANARLIAAAPELLAALEAICLQYYGSGAPGGGLPLVNGIRACTTGLADEIKKARAAIAKATGEV